MNTEIDVVHPDVSLWDSREEIVHGNNIGTANARLVLAYLEHIALGKRTNSFLTEHSLTWLDLNRWLSKAELYELSQVALRTGNRVRLKLAEDELLRRGVEGIDKNIYHQGEVVDTVKEYSDPLLVMLLKAENPDKYADRSKVEHQGVVLNLQVEGVR